MSVTTPSPPPGHTAGSAPLPARASWDGQVVAATSRAVPLTSAKGVVLGFPVDDVSWDLLEETAEVETTDLGSARVYSLSGRAPNPRGSVWTVATLNSTVEGNKAVHRYDNLGLVVLDPFRVRVEILDRPAGGEDRDETTKAFPVWGDMADMLTLLDVQQDHDGSWVGTPAGLNEDRPVVEASQLLGQSLVAAIRQTGGRRPVSAHMTFFRVADARVPLRFELEEINSGRTFTTISVRVLQDGRPRAAGTFLLDVTAPDVVPFQEPAPPCAGPYDSVPYDMGVLGRDLRVADGAYTDDAAAPVGPPVIDAWVRMQGVPADPAVHVGLLAQFTGHMSIAAALRPHEGVGQSQAHITLSTGINALHFALHRDVRVDEWVRFHHHAVSVQGGMCHADNAAYDEQGRLLASFSVEAMIRGFADGGVHDGRTAI